MPNTVCLVGPSFSIIGDTYFVAKTVNFQISFDGTGQAETLAYEWFLDNTLIIGHNLIEFTGDINCGSHTIGARILSNDGWSGIKSLTFNTCKVPLSIFIYGPDSVDEGSSANYSVLQSFSDATTEDITFQYTLISTEGGSFSGRTFTAGEITGISLQVTIKALQGGIEKVSKQITIIGVTFNASVLVVDLYNNTSLNVIGIIDNAEVSLNHIAAYTGNNILPVASAPANALILASDLNASETTNWRFEFNLAKLVADHPGTLDFVFYIKGRSTSSGAISGSFSTKSPGTQMTLQGNAGSYMPGVIGETEAVQPTNFNSIVAAGANGSYAENNLSTIIRLNYNLPNNIVTYTVPSAPIEVNDFDFMAVRYHWQQSAGSDLDTITGFENNGTTSDNIYVGYGQPNLTVPANKIPQTEAYLWWAGDNTGVSGYECILIGIEEFVASFPASPNIIEVGLYAVWYGGPGSGDFTVELVTYKGGTMSLQGTNFINTGGTEVSSNMIPVHTLIHNQAHVPAEAYKVGTLKYNKTTASAVIEIH